MSCKPLVNNRLQVTAFVHHELIAACRSVCAYENKTSTKKPWAYTTSQGVLGGLKNKAGVGGVNNRTFQNKSPCTPCCMLLPVLVEGFLVGLNI